MDTSVIEVQNLHKQFGNQVIFDDFSMQVQEGEFVAVTGKSGSGKSTLLNMIGLLDKEDRGQIRLFGEKAPKPFSRRASRLLRMRIGYLFQNFALIHNESVKYNLRLAIRHHRFPQEEALIQNALGEVGLEDATDKKIFQCSGGEQQRIAIARLLIKPCDLILADEPTGSLDAENKEEVLRLLTEMNRKGKTLVIVTHDPDVVNRSQRCVAI